MFREIKTKKGEGDAVRRRWFVCDYFDMFVWQEREGGSVVGFQLSYDREKKERMLSWSRKSGFTHGMVDAGEHSPKRNMAPLHLPGGEFPGQEVLERFRVDAEGLEPGIAAQVLEKIRAFDASGE